MKRASCSCENREGAKFCGECAAPLAEAVAGNLEFGGLLTEVEVVYRTMAKEDRFARRLATDDLERAVPGAERAA